MNGQQFNVIWSDSGIRYKGPVVANRLQGDGKMFFSSGNIRKIEGQWQQDKLVKCTRLIMEDGSCANNYDHEKGILTGSGQVIVGKTRYEAVWNQEGKMEGQGKIFNNETGHLLFDGQF